MTTFVCPMHDTEFSDDGLPERVNAYCLACLAARDAAGAKAQHDFDQLFRAWHGWQRESGLPIRGRTQTVANWIPKGRAQEAVAKAVQQFSCSIASQTSRGKGLTLLGPVGVGKTHLACALVTAAARVGVSARYAVWGDVLERGRVTTYGMRDAATQKYLTDLKRVPLLVLDEVGMRVATDVEQRLLFEIIDARYGDHRSTVLVSNLTVDTLGDLGERVADRLREMNLTLSIPGESLRDHIGDAHALFDAAPVLSEPTPPTLSMAVCMNGLMIETPIVIRKPEAWT